MLSEHVCWGGLHVYVSHLSRTLKNVLMAEHAGALFTFQVGASHMDADSVYRSHFGSRYLTRADAVTQAFLLLLFDSRTSATLPSPQHVFPHPLPNTNTSALPPLLPQNAQTSAPTQKKLASPRSEQDFPGIDLL